MEINYIILAHRYPRQVKRLIEKLSTPKSSFYIHIDKNVPMELFLYELADLSNVNFVYEREEGIWGDIGIVLATLNALKQILRDHRNGYCVLLSGQDYPIRNNDYIDSYLNENYGTNFISKGILPSSDLSFNGLDRINRYKVNISAKRGNYVQLFSILEKEFYKKKNLKNILKLIWHNKIHYLLKIISKRQFPKHLKPYVGSQWWALTIDMVNEIVEFVEQNPSYIKYHTYSLLPDEMFFQSIVMNLAEKKSNLIFKDSLTYVNWSRKNCELPVTFALSDFEELMLQPEKLFARKFDIEIDDKILDKIDASHSKNGM